MMSLEELNSTLRFAVKLLEVSAAQVRDVELSPDGRYIRLIGEAMANVFEVQQAIYRERPDLKPAFLDEATSNPDADRRLTHALAEAWRRADAGDRQGAIAVLRSFVSTEASNLHREIAHHELEQLEATPGA
jgi:hypothetical protein